jgi:hypothetical protein
MSNPIPPSFILERSMRMRRVLLKQRHIEIKTNVLVTIPISSSGWE